MVPMCVVSIYCILIGLIKVSIGDTIGTNIGAEVHFVFDFQKNPVVCKELNIYFSALDRESLWKRYTIIWFYANWGKCSGVVSNDYQPRISYQAINFPRSVTFALSNVSSSDTGKYIAKSGKTTLGETILFVADQTLPVCTGQNVEFEFALPPFPFTEAINVMFYYSTTKPRAVIHVADPESGACTSNMKSLRCRITEYELSIKIMSMQFSNQGIYAFIGHGSGVVHESAIIYMIDCTEIFRGDPMINNTKEEEKTIDQTCKYSESLTEYFIGGGVVAGIVLVSLTSIFICKRCRREKRNIASFGEHDNAELHYYSTPENQDHLVSERVDSSISVVGSQQGITFTTETNEIRFGVNTQESSKSTKPLQSGYITPY
ncbi:hypothetical protein ACJMK2_025164 [Sinanodonta woodiana]|uniref:Uncharacterized protein n=1 Tax=Sinanodonta woodiana TaxID=1069815 RepID=A0ABD3XFN0_SINWO